MQLWLAYFDYLFASFTIRFHTEEQGEQRILIFTE